MARVSAGLARPGMDLRHWVSYATVGTVGADGAPDFTDEQAIVITPGGVMVDVVLEPSGYPITCRYGICSGTVTTLSPIHAGDQVVVGLPDGDLAMVPQVLALISGASDPIPLETDGKPVFRNDRHSIFARGVPVEIRTDGGGHLRVNVDGTIQLGGTDAQQRLILGDVYTGAHNTLDQGLETFLGALGTYAAAIQTIADPSGAATTALASAIAAMMSAVQAFDQASGRSLSAISKSK